MAQLREAAAALRLSLTDEELMSYRALAESAIASQRRLDELVEPRPPVKYPRESVSDMNAVSLGA